MKTNRWKTDHWSTKHLHAGALRLIAFLCIFMTSLCLLPSVTMAQSNTSQIKIRETIWGFNGKIKPGQFNPVSILIDNGKSEAIDGVIVLQKSNNLISATGTVYQQTAFVGATGRRWFQFYPYIAEDFRSKWQLRLVDDKTKQSISLGQIQQPSATQQMSQKAVKASELVQAIALLPSDSAAKVPSNVKRYPEEIFPPYVTATAALHTVFLDDEPDWDEPRQKAFMDWVRLGGNVHILQSRNGQFPRFTDLLASLDQPLATFRVGLGRIQRQQIRLSNLSENAAEDAIRKGLTLDRRLQMVDMDQLDEMEDEQAMIDSSPSSLDMQMYRQMQERTQPEHAWWLIFMLAVIYVLLIFPGCYLLSKNRQLHFLTTYGAITGLSLVFSLVFLFIGQRGYGESTWLQTLAVAKVADNGDLAIQQWNTLFVTAGDQYLLPSTDSQALMNAGVSGDNTVASVAFGKEAFTSVRIPPYSAQSLNSTRYIKGDPWNLKVTAQQSQGEQLIRLTIQADDSFPQVDDQCRFYAMSGRHIYAMKFDAETKQLNLFGSRRAVSDFCRISNDFRFRGWGGQIRKSDFKNKDKVYLDEAAPSMVHRSLLADHIDAPRYLIVPPDRIRLLALTPLPKELDLQVNAEVRRTGWILYTRDLINSLSQ